MSAPGIQRRNFGSCYNLKALVEAWWKMSMDRVLIEELQLLQGGLGHGGAAETQTEVMVCLLQGSWC